MPTKHRMFASSSTSRMRGAAHAASICGGSRGGQADHGEHRRLEANARRALILPPCASTMRRASARPRPMPGTADSLRPRSNGSNNFSGIDSGRPGPASLTCTMTRRLPAARRSRSACRSACAFRHSPAGSPARVRSASRRLRAAAGRRADRCVTGCVAQRLAQFAQRAADDFFQRLPLPVRVPRRGLAGAPCPAGSRSAAASSRLSADRRASGAATRPRSCSVAASAAPRIVVNGVRRSCETAASSVLRMRSPSICTRRALRDLDEVHALKRERELAAAGFQQALFLRFEQPLRHPSNSITSTPRTRIGAFSGR